MKAYILRLSFKGIEPEVWRKIIIPAGATFNRLHETIQYVTNFKSYMEPYHNFRFPLEDVVITNSEALIEEKVFDGKKVRQPTRIKIDAYLEKYGGLLYQYDFGDNWEITIDLQDTVEDYYFGFPTLLDGGGIAPPEDVGGPVGYMEFLKIIQDPTHPEYTFRREWAEKVGYKSLDIENINSILKHVKFKKTEWEHVHHENYLIISDKYRGSEVVDAESIANKELIVDYIISCTNLYGIVPKHIVIDIYNSRNRSKISNKELQAIITEPNYKKILEKFHIIVVRDRFVHEILDRVKLIEPLEQATIGKPYYIPDREELLRYKDELYYEKTRHHRHLANMMERDFRNEIKSIQEEIDNLVAELKIVNSNFNLIIRNFLSKFQFHDINYVNEYTRVILEISNTTKIWENRGYSPKELSDLTKPKQVKVLAGVKIGRNDPCHCGSGRKYKKCCGR